MTGSARAPRWKRLYVVLCLILFLPVVFFAFSRPYEFGYDFWETAATVRELAARPFHPTNPILAVPEEDVGRFVPYTLFWGLFKRLTGLGIFAVMGLAAVTNYWLLVFGLYRFVSRQFKSESLPSFVLVTMVLVWGRGYPWANAYHLQMFLITAPYVGFFGFGLSLLALSFLVSYCDDGRWRDLVLYAVLSVVAFVTHALAGAFCYVTAFAVLLARGNVRRLLLMQGVPLLALAVFLVWPYFSFLDLLVKGTGEGTFAKLLARGQVRALAAALIGILIVAYYTVMRRHLFVCYGFLICLSIYVVAIVGRISFAVRFIFFVAFFLHLAIAVFMDRGLVGRAGAPPWRGWRRAAVLLLAVGLVVPSMWFRWIEMQKHFKRVVGGKYGVHRYLSPARHLFFLARYVSYGDVVMTVPREGWAVPAISEARIVAPPHVMALLAGSHEDRQTDVRKFFEGDLSVEEREAIAQKYGVSHILVNLERTKRWHESFRRDLDVLGTETARDGPMVLYELAAGG